MHGDGVRATDGNGACVHNARDNDTGATCPDRNCLRFEVERLMQII
jgi:hypothetical protein